MLRRRHVGGPSVSSDAACKCKHAANEHAHRTALRRLDSNDVGTLPRTERAGVMLRPHRVRVDHRDGEEEEIPRKVEEEDAIRDVIERVDAAHLLRHRGEGEREYLQCKLRRFQRGAERAASHDVHRVLRLDHGELEEKINGVCTLLVCSSSTAAAAADSSTVRQQRLRPLAVATRLHQLAATVLLAERQEGEADEASEDDDAKDEDEARELQIPALNRVHFVALQLKPVVPGRDDPQRARRQGHRDLPNHGGPERESRHPYHVAEREERAVGERWKTCVCECVCVCVRVRVAVVDTSVTLRKEKRRGMRGHRSAHGGEGRCAAGLPKQSSS